MKTYDSHSRTGVLLADDGATEFHIGPEAMEAGMFRFLRPGQRVTFDLVEREGELVVSNPRIGIA